MNKNVRSIRPFIGAQDFDLSKRFYVDLGFEEVDLGSDLTLFKMASIAFYLQRAYVKDWVDNTMVFVELADIDVFHKRLVTLDLPSSYPNVRVSGIRVQDWGRVCFVHDPSGILWQFGSFER